MSSCGLQMAATIWGLVRSDLPGSRMCQSADVCADAIRVSLCVFVGWCGCSGEDDDGQEIDGEDIAWEDDDEGDGDGDDNRGSSSSVAAGGRAGCPDFEEDDVEEEPEERRVRTLAVFVFQPATWTHFLKIRGMRAHCVRVHDSSNVPLWDDVLSCPPRCL